MGVIKSRMIRRVQHMAGREEKGKTHRVLVGRLEGCIAL
jgi:hypothetical protein